MPNLSDIFSCWQPVWLAAGHGNPEQGGSGRPGPQLPQAHPQPPRRRRWGLAGRKHWQVDISSDVDEY